MGLDITAYSNLQKIDAVFDSDGTPIDPITRTDIEDVVQLCVNYDFPGRATDIDDNAVYRYADSMGFRAGSYSGYNQWRNDLAKLAGYPAIPVDRYNKGNIEHRNDQGAWEADEGPFWELINFSDCEGVIGSIVCAKLAKDFEDYQEKANAVDDFRFKEKYSEWRKAFELASNGGAVDFH